MPRSRGPKLAWLALCSSGLLAPAAAALAQPEGGSPPMRVALPPTPAQVLSDGGWRNDFDVDYAALTPAGIEQRVGSLCAPDA